MAAKMETLIPAPVSPQFVVDTCLPPYIDTELGARLSGEDTPGELFDVFERNGFGRWNPYSRDRHVFQYVEAIRDTFRARAAHDPERYRRSSGIVARWLLENDELVDEALIFAIEAGDFELADRVFVSLVVGNPDSYITDRFLLPLQRVPESVLPDHPMLAFGLALALTANPLLRGEAPRIADIAASSTARPAYLEPAVDAFSVASMQAIAHRLAWRYDDSAEAALAAVRSLDAMDRTTADRFSDHLGTVLRRLSYSLLQGERMEEGMEAIGRAIALNRVPTTRNYSMVFDAGMSALIGRMDRANALLAGVDHEAWPPEQRHTHMNGLGIIAKSLAHLDAFEFSASADVLHDADSYMQTSEFWCFIAGLWVSTRHGLGERLAPPPSGRREGWRNRPRARAWERTTPRRGALGLALIADGEIRPAERMLAGAPGDSPCVAAARIGLLLASGRDREAFERAAPALALAGHTVRTRAETLAFAAAAALRVDEEQPAWTWLSEAAVAWETYGPRLHLSALPPRDLRRLQEFGRRRGSATLRRYLDVPTPSAPPPDRALPQLTPREHVVLSALAAHDTNRAIADALVVSPHTVKAQLRSVYRKLGVASRREALAMALEIGLI